MIRFKGLVALGLLLATSFSLMFQDSTVEARRAPQFGVVGRYSTGLADGTGNLTAAETVAYGEERLFLTNSSDNSFDIVDISELDAPEFIKRVSLAPYGAGPNSVAYSKGFVAIAVESSPKTDRGFVVFFDADGNYLNKVRVGALPDMLTFSPNGRYLLVANEGEPNNDYSIDPEGSISIMDLGKTRADRLKDSDVATVGFAGFDAASLKAQGVRIFGPNASVAQDLEPEYITVTQNSKTAYVTLQENNALAAIDIKSLKVTAILPLGYKDHSLPANGLDASDRDSAITIKSWPVYGMYQPDAIASYRVNGKTYLVTANEGDARDYNPGLQEEASVKSLVLDATAFPNASDLQKDAALGRLTVSKVNGDTDGDGDYDKLYAFGGRSFSIWDEAGKQVYDSGDQLEQQLAKALPTNFNANNTSSAFDNRSDNKGPEPEGVNIGKVRGVTYAFVGLERIGGVMVFDVSNPANPAFEQYVASRDFSVAPNLTDSGPEIVHFIQDGPDDEPLIVVGNEVSGSITLIAPKQR